VRSDSVHTYPTTDEHITDGLDCWCSPVYYLPCDECDVAEYRGIARGDLPAMPLASGCWKCTNGLILLSRAEAEATDQGIIIVHNR
jgi:hypothetical protein